MNDRAPAARSWSPRPLGVAGLWVAVVVFAVLALLADAPGRILGGAAAALLAVEALRSTLRRPTVELLPGGLAVVDSWARLVIPWTEVVTARPVRLGRVARARALEIETVDRAVVIAAYRLDAEPFEVAEAIRAARLLN